MTRLILDVMGGDFAPHAILKGAIKALPDLAGASDQNFELVLLGDERVVAPLLKKISYRTLAHALKTGSTRDGVKIRFIHAPEKIEMDESIRAVRSKPQASVNLGCEMAAKDFRERTPSAFISAGHSGAIFASALLKMGRLKRIERPAIAVRLPVLSSSYKRGALLLDVGANVDCKPEHLRDFGVMGAIYASVETPEIKVPRVALLSNGEEKNKGTETTRHAYEMLEKIRELNFTGYIEGKEIFSGDVDVVVTDGFVGNVVLKTAEGLAISLISILKREAKTSVASILGLLFSSGILTRLKKKVDYAETGAAPLLGVAGYVFICHGRSDPRAIKSALLRAQSALKEQYVERLERVLGAPGQLTERNENG